MLYAVPLADDTKTTFEMHVHEDDLLVKLGPSCNAGNGLIRFH